jgi:hypothetical protein
VASRSVDDGFAVAGAPVAAALEDEVVGAGGGAFSAAVVADLLGAAPLGDVAVSALVGGAKTVVLGLAAGVTEAEPGVTEEEVADVEVVLEEEDEEGDDAPGAPERARRASLREAARSSGRLFGTAPGPPPFGPSSAATARTRPSPTGGPAVARETAARAARRRSARSRRSCRRAALARAASRVAVTRRSASSWASSWRW